MTVVALPSQSLAEYRREKALRIAALAIALANQSDCTHDEMAEAILQVPALPIRAALVASAGAKFVADQTWSLVAEILRGYGKTR